MATRISYQFSDSLLATQNISSNVTSNITTGLSPPSFAVRPSNDILGAQSYYIFHINLADTNQLVDTLTVTFPSGSGHPDDIFKLADSFFVISDDLTVNSFSKTSNSLTFRLNPSSQVHYARIIVDGIINPLITQQNLLTLVASNAGQIVFGPLESLVKFEQLKTPSIGDNEIRNQKLGESSVTSDKIARSAVGNREIAPGAITSDKITDGSVRKSDTNFIKVDRIFDGVDGWNPDGDRTSFSVITSVLTEGTIMVSLSNSQPSTCAVYNTIPTGDLPPIGGVRINCNVPPSNGATLYLTSIDFGGL
jgi:hypothetical protein